MNFEEEKNEISNSKQPILIVILLVIIAGACFYYFNQQITSSITKALTPNTEPFSLAADPSIKFDFLNSKEFADLVSFPDYPSFKEDDELTVKPGRINPFSASGIGIQRPQVSTESPKVQDQANPESPTNANN
ncbi:hypothetical protein M0R01_03265 [bacterium]|nr:hypothetical protein [bacterium]